MGGKSSNEFKSKILPISISKANSKCSSHNLDIVYALQA